jgi:predicted nucleotidyltransferase
MQYKDSIATIILFWSVARGEAREESDIDLLIVTFMDMFKLRRALSALVLDLLFETGEYLSIKTLSLDDFESLKQLKSSFLSNVMRDGISIDRGAIVT